MAGILVIGATGSVGRPLVADLVARGERVRAASRSGQGVAGAEGVALDLLAPGAEGAVAAAMEGVDRVYALSPPGHMDPVGFFAPVTALAAERGAKVVIHTAMGVEADDAIPLRRAEIALERAGIPFVILRPNWFTQNFDTYWAGQIAGGALRLPAAEGATSFVDARDIAAAGAAALTTDRFDGEAVTLTGPEALTYGEAAARIAAARGIALRYEPVDDEEFVAGLTGQGMPEVYARQLAGLMGVVRAGWAAPVSDGVARLTGRPARSLDDWLRDPG